MYRVERKTDGLRVAHLPDGLGLRRVLRHTFGLIRLGLLLQMCPQLAFQRRGAHVPCTQCVYFTLSRILIHIQLPENMFFCFLLLFLTESAMMGKTGTSRD